METCKDRIGSALETLRPTTSWERTTAAGQGIDGVLMGGRGFGVAMEALLNYLGSEYGSTFALGEEMNFVANKTVIFGPTTIPMSSVSNLLHVIRRCKIMT